jgi:hypothetical protein
MQCCATEQRGNIMSQRKSKRFQIEVLHDRQVLETKYLRNKDKEVHEIEDEDGNMIANPNFGKNFIEVKEAETVPESYMVYFPAGHSVWFRTKADMARAGIVEHANFEIDLDTGLPVEVDRMLDLKQHVMKNTREVHITNRRM